MATATVLLQASGPCTPIHPLAKSLQVCVVCHFLLLDAQMSGGCGQAAAAAIVRRLSCFCTLVTWQSVRVDP